MADAFRALKDANPRKDPRFDSSPGELDALRDRVVASDPLASAGAPRPAGRTRALRLAGLAASAVVVAGIVTAFAMSAPTPTGRPIVGTPTIQSAYAAVAKAVTDTAAAAKSGTIKTTTIAKWPERPNPTYGKTSPEDLGRKQPKTPEPKILPASELRIDTTFAWHGDDASLQVTSDGKPHDTLYVGGKYYEQYEAYAPGEKPNPGDPQWMHYPLEEQGQMFDDPQAWVDGVRGDVQGTGLRRLLTATKDLKQTTNADGSKTFSGTAPASAIRDEQTGVSGLPYVSGPLLKVHDLSTPVALTVTVGDDGLIREVRTSYKSDGADWTYVSTYSDLGASPAIAGPGPGTVKEWDPSMGKG
jgi:hypothetical protein